MSRTTNNDVSVNTVYMVYLMSLTHSVHVDCVPPNDNQKCKYST